MYDKFGYSSDSVIFENIIIIFVYVYSLTLFAAAPRTTAPADGSLC